MRKKIEISIFAVLGIVVVTLLGITFAYFFAATSNSGNGIQGQTLDFSASLALTPIYRATNMVPLHNDLVTTAIGKANNKCIDKNGRDVCSLYHVTLSNTGETVTLTPYITTTSTTYTTTNLKCQLFSVTTSNGVTTYSEVSDILTISKTENGKVYFTNGGNNITVNISNNATQTFALVIWLMDTDNSQPEDYSRTFNGTITFEGGNGQVYADFTA